MANLIVPDFIAMPPESPVVVGKEANMESWNEFFEESTFEFTVTTDEVVAADDWAFLRGTGRWTLTPKEEGEPRQGQVTYLHIFQKQADGSWKLARDIWNSDQPPPETPTE